MEYCRTVDKEVWGRGIHLEFLEWVYIRVKISVILETVEQLGAQS